jgi:hypothetical protein
MSLEAGCPPLIASAAARNVWSVTAA